MDIVNKQDDRLFFLPSPFSLVPNKVNNAIIASVFNQIFAQAAKQGDLDFLEGNKVLIKVIDIDLSFTLGLESGRLIGNPRTHKDSLQISANSCDFLDMVSKKKDPDTLFFQRKIKMQGSTELGLFVKNFLDAFEVESHWISAKVEKILQTSYPLLSKLLCKHK